MIYALLLIEPRSEEVVVMLKNVRERQHICSPLFWHQCGCIYQHLQGQTDSGVARAPALEVLRHSVTLLALAAPRNDFSTRWLFWIMRPSGSVRRESWWEEKAHFLGVCFLTWNHYLFSSAHLAAYAKWRARWCWEQSSRLTASVLNSAAAFLLRKDVVSPLHCPHPPQINPYLPIKHGTVGQGRRRVIDILKCMSFVYVAMLSQGLFTCRWQQTRFA